MARNLSPQEQIDLSRRAGRQLARAFENGAEPQAIDVRLAMHGREFCVGQLPVAVHQFLEGDGSYTKRSGGWMIGGGLFGAAYSAGRIATNAAGNAVRKSMAARDAAGQWRHVDGGTLYLTNRRFGIQGKSSWWDLWFEDIRMTDCDSKSIILEMATIPRVALEISAPDYWHVMFTKLAYNKIEMPTPPTDGIELP